MSEASLKQLRCFLAVYSEGSFTKAAKSVRMAGSPVNQSVLMVCDQVDAPDANLQAMEFGTIYSVANVSSESAVRVKSERTIPSF